MESRTYLASAVERAMKVQEVMMRSDGWTIEVVPGGGDPRDLGTADVPVETAL